MTAPQLEKFNSFLLRFVRLSNSKIISPIYRGDNLHGLCNKLGVEFNTCQESNYKELLSRLFVVGDKSKSYLSKAHFNFNRNWTFGVNDSDNAIYNFIFDTIAENAKKIKSKYVQDFFTKNDSFKAYFLNKTSNKQSFSKTILALQLQKQISIRNYYLKLLHQIGSINYRDRSLLLSTSRKYNVAKGFASSRKDNGVIIHAWQPFLYWRNVELKKYNLPTYTGRPYEYQDEESLIAGIFPHYIIGLEILTEGMLYVNPNIISNTIDRYVFTDGLNIDQSNFEEIIPKTNYSKYVTKAGNDYFDTDVKY